MNQDITSVKRGMKRFLDSQARGQKVYYQPWYSVYNIAPLANQTTGLLSPQTIPFFQVGRGQVGNGFNRPLTGAETSLPIGANGVMPGGIEFIATHLGVDLFPSLPDPVKEGFTEKSFLVQKRLSHEWMCGATRYWPSAEFGLQSQSVSTTVGQTTISYGVNGRCALRELPEGAEIYFPAKQQIAFEIETVEPLYLTVNGEPAQGGQGVLEEALIAVVMVGWSFEVITT